MGAVSYERGTSVPPVGVALPPDAASVGQVPLSSQFGTKGSQRADLAQSPIYSHGDPIVYTSFIGIRPAIHGRGGGDVCVAPCPDAASVGQVLLSESHLQTSLSYKPGFNQDYFNITDKDRSV